MQAATINELKTELKSLPADQLRDLCLRLAKYKKENKELLTYLLLEADDESAYVKNLKEEVDEQFNLINRSRINLVKKSLSKILRNINKRIRFSGHKQTEVELLLYFCFKLRHAGIRYRSHSVLLNMYNRQIQKIEKAMTTLHEDLQYDYRMQLNALEEN